MNNLKFDREKFLEILKKYSYFTGVVDWENIKQKLWAIKDINLQEINKLLKLIDKHSFAEIHAEEFKSQSKAPEIKVKELVEEIGCLELPGFYTQKEEVYQTNYQDIVTALEKLASKKKLILDLSENGGGNMYPWIAALATLYNQRTVGYFEYKYKKEKDGWNLADNGIYCGKEKWFEVINKSNISFEKIAVLISNKTASSGEAIALSFISQAGTKLVGQKTAGFTTGNEDYPVGDYTIWLSTCMMQDRNGNSYVDGVVPEIMSDDPMKSALEWLR